MEASSEAYSEPCQTPKVEVFEQILIGLQFLNIIAISFILDVWQDSLFAFLVDSKFQKKSRFRCLTGFEFTFVVINDFRKKDSS